MLNHISPQRLVMSAGGRLRLRTFAKASGWSCAERVTEQIAVAVLGPFRNHGIPLTDELRAAAGDLCLAAVLTRWYHDGSWSDASEIAIGLVEEVTAAGPSGEDLVDAMRDAARGRGLLGWTDKAVRSLLVSGEPICIGSTADWNNGERYYVGGRHRALAMMQQGVRRIRTGHQGLRAQHLDHPPPHSASTASGSYSSKRPSTSAVLSRSRRRRSMSSGFSACSRAIANSYSIRRKVFRSSLSAISRWPLAARRPAGARA